MPEYIYFAFSFSHFSIFSSFHLYIFWYLQGLCPVESALPDHWMSLPPLFLVLKAHFHSAPFSIRPSAIRGSFHTLSEMVASFPWIYPVRFAQIIFGIVVLGLTAYGSWLSPTYIPLWSAVDHLLTLLQWSISGTSPAQPSISCSLMASGPHSSRLRILPSHPPIFLTSPIASSSSPWMWLPWSSGSPALSRWRHIYPVLAIPPAVRAVLFRLPRCLALLNGMFVVALWKTKCWQNKIGRCLRSPRP